MYRLKPRFLAVFGLLCLIGSNAMAVPSVKVLGANNTGIKAVPAKTATTTANTGSVKKASVKTAGVAPKQQGLTTTTGRIGTGAAAAGVGRLPVISTKTNIQTGYKAPAAVSNISKNNQIDELSGKIDSLQLDLDNKANVADLDNYYTRDEIDDISSDYYTAAEVDEKLSEIDGLVSGNEETLTSINERVTQNESGITNINTRIDGVSERITGISERVDNNQNDILTINGQINNINSRIDDINTISSIQYVQQLSSQINGYRLQLGEVVAASKKIYDSGTQEYKYVTIVDNFDTSVLTEANN